MQDQEEGAKTAAELLGSTEELGPLERAQALVNALEAGVGEDDRQAVMEAVRNALDSARSDLAGEMASRAVEWLKEKWGPDRTCPYCDHPYWNIGPPIAPESNLGWVSEPMFSAECANCGNTVWINAVRAGLWESDSG